MLNFGIFYLQSVRIAILDVVLILAFVGLTGLRGMEAHVGRLDPLITGMALTDTGYIVDSLGTTHIAVLHNGVVVILGRGELQHIRRHVGPAVGILSVTTGQSHRVTDMVGTAVIAGKHEVRALKVFTDIREGTLEFSDVLDGSSNVSLWLIELAAGEAKVIGRTWHDLHKAFGTGKGNSLGVESGLLIALGSQQAPVPTDFTAIGHKELVVMGDDAALGVEHRREDTATHFLRGEHGSLFRLDFGDEMRTIPGLEGGGKVGLLAISLYMAGCRPGDEIGLAGVEAMDELKTIATDIDTKVTAQRVGEALTDQILGAERFAVVVVVGIGATDGSQDEFTTGLYVAEVEAFSTLRHCIVDDAPRYYEWFLFLLRTR